MKISLTLLIPFFLFAGCIVTPSRNTRDISDYTGFLPIDENTMIYWNPQKKIRDYKKFFLENIEVYPNPRKKINPEDRTLFTNWEPVLYEKTRENLKGRYPWMDAPGKNILSVKIRIYDIKPFRWLTSATGTRYLKADTATKGSKFYVECFDGKTKELIFGLATLVPGENYMAFQDPELIPNVEEVYIQWLSFLRSMLNKSLEIPNPLIPDKPASSTSPRQ